MMFISSIEAQIETCQHRPPRLSLVEVERRYSEFPGQGIWRGKKEQEERPIRFVSGGGSAVL
jgi:hypothetical protein